MFGDRAIVDIKSTEYQRIMNIYGETVGYDYLSRINSTIRKTIQLAQSDKIVLDDFTSNVELFAGKEAQKNEEKYIHSVEDYHRLVNYLEKQLDYETTVIYHVLYIIAKTGMRYGEAIGITDDDTKLEDHYLYTHRRYNTTTWGGTKAKNDTSIRAVPIDDKTVTVLPNMIKERKRINSLLQIKNKEKFLFFHYDLEQGLRHTYGSYLLHSHIDMGVVAKILGHKDIQMLIQVYGHTLTEKIDKEFKEVEQIMNRI